MSAFALYRSVRGVRSTIRLVASTDAVAFGVRDGLKLYAKDAIAPDGSPTGVELAFTFTMCVVLLRARWRQNPGAARLRALLLDDPGDRIANALGYYMFSTISRSATTGVVALDFEKLHSATALIGTTPEIARRLRTTQLKMKTAFAPIYTELWNAGEPLEAVEVEAVPPLVERDLIAAIVDDPTDTDAVAIYGDWLEQSGRLDEARELR